ncbi:DUF2795 domain-containing protein [Azospirillum sp. ST 5-10]|uniref:DUF2795 domain-containing protein n=1 Tax=unclassified Azospirillum TaxID=2630922 RepID=UPI003F4A33AB
MTRGMGGHSPANLTHHLKGIDFPAEKPDLVRHARAQGADDEVIGAIEAMPDGRYGSMADVMKGFGKSH